MEAAGGGGRECVRVAVRCRPLSSKERADGRAVIVDVDGAAGTVALRPPGNGGGNGGSNGGGGETSKVFTFDAAFDSSAAQADVYAATAARIVAGVLQGYNGTVFAYGQTGTGKTHTMEGTAADPGVIPRAFDDIFAAIGAADAGAAHLVRASFLEIYNEEVRDLLAAKGLGGGGKDQQQQPQKLELREHKGGGVYVKGLSAFVVRSVAEIAGVLEVGKRNRSVGATLMNQDSSRSHSVFTITVETASGSGGGDGGGGGGGGAGTSSSSATSKGGAGGGHVRVGKLHLVDLAGSERQGKTGATGDRLKEATSINLSLSALGNVISALVDGRGGHVPYRDSKLTRILQDSLGGNTKTVMVANVGPADWNHDETLSTLRYAHRAKSITNKPRVNEDPKDAMLRAFQSEIEALRAALAGADGGGTPPPPPPPRAMSAEEVKRLRQQIAAELQEQLLHGGDGGDSSGGGGGAPNNKELTPAQLAAVAAEAEAKAAAEAARLEAAAKAAEADAARYGRKQRAVQEKLARAAEESQAVAAQKEALAARLRQMEGKILQGEARGGLAELARAKEAELARRERELQRRRAEEAAAAAEIVRVEDEAAAAGKRFASLAEDAQDKERRLRRLWRRCQEADAEASEAWRGFQAEREELLQALRELRQEDALREAVLGAFASDDDVRRLLVRAVWDDEAEAWALLPPPPPRIPAPPPGTAWGVVPASGRPVLDARAGRPVCAFARAAVFAGDMNPRFRCENILALELDLPERLTADAPDDPRVRAAIDAALWPGCGHVVVPAAMLGGGGGSGGGGAAAAARPASARRPASAARGVR